MVIDVQVLVGSRRVLSSDRDRRRPDRVVDEDGADHDSGDEADRREAKSDWDKLPRAVVVEHRTEAGKCAVATGKRDFDERTAFVAESEAGFEQRPHDKAGDSELTGRRDPGHDHV